MVNDRAHFKYALRQCKRQEVSIFADKLAKDLDKDDDQFWHDFEVQSRSQVSLSESVEGMSDSGERASLTAGHLKKSI